MAKVFRKDVSNVASGTTVRIDLPESQAAGQTIVVTAWGGGERVRISLICSATNRIIVDDGLSGASATQIFAVDPGFTAWVEAKVDGTGGTYDMALTAAVL